MASASCCRLYLNGEKKKNLQIGVGGKIEQEFFFSDVREGEFVSLLALSWLVPSFALLLWAVEREAGSPAAIPGGDKLVMGDEGWQKQSVGNIH